MCNHICEKTLIDSESGHHLFSSEQVLSPIESNLLLHSAISTIKLAKKVAAKKAFFACLQKLDVQFSDLRAVSILNDALGKPYFSFATIIDVLLEEVGVNSVLLSISDEKHTAFAYVVLNLGCVK
jgi:phosphopantetheinyl transferase (holo-ACP synthase)